jgi:uncharacterized coiled-coil protein SlyX
VSQQEPTTHPKPAQEAAIDVAEELLKMLSSASREASVLLQSLSGSNGTIALLRNDVANRDARIVELSAAVAERNHDIEEMRRNISELQQSVHKSEAHNADLSERLKTSLQMDSITQNQELITLKNNLQNSLKVEYADYIANKDSEFNPDTYGALVGSLARIFKTLRRFGITID